ncbi:MAG: hypothetical protein AB8H86_00900 [Polyangiales bacterium]
MPIAAKSLFFLLVAKTLFFAGLATQFDPMEEPVPFIVVALMTLAMLSLKTRRAWWFPFVVELLTLLGSLATLGENWSAGSYRNNRKFASAALALVAFIAIVLVLRRSVRDWYRSRTNSSS